MWLISYQSQHILITSHTQKKLQLVWEGRKTLILAKEYSVQFRRRRMSDCTWYLRLFPLKLGTLGDVFVFWGFRVSLHTVCIQTLSQSTLTQLREAPAEGLLLVCSRANTGCPVNRLTPSHQHGTIHLHVCVGRRGNGKECFATSSLTLHGFGRYAEIRGGRRPISSTLREFNIHFWYLQLWSNVPSRPTYARSVLGGGCTSCWRRGSPTSSCLYFLKKDASFINVVLITLRNIVGGCWPPPSAWSGSFWRSARAHYTEKSHPDPNYSRGSHSPLSRPY